MRPVIPVAILVSALALSACGSVYDREPVPEPAPRVERAPAPASSGGYSAHRPSDRMLHDKVHSALGQAPSLRGSDITVTVEEGRVHLRGTVHSPQQRQAAHDVAHSVEGVRSVVTDDLRLR